MASAGKPIADHNHQQERRQPVLKCPRCNSSNTKFCYYNNYSLSQPRHFCKACKRYWTRGGTLRNVHVGGGCRKNKRIKTTFTAADDSSNPNPYPDSNPNLDHSTSSNNNLNPMYGLLQVNPKYPRFNSKVSGNHDVSRHDLVQPQMSSLGLGFSALMAHVHNSKSLVSSYPSMYSGGLTSGCNSDHIMSSLLASRLQQQPTFLKFASYYGDGVGSVVNEVQMEGPKSSTNWNNSLNGDQNDEITALESSDPSSFNFHGP